MHIGHLPPLALVHSQHPCPCPFDHFLHALSRDSPPPTPLLLPLLISQLVLQRIVSGLALLPVLIGGFLPAGISSLSGCRGGGRRWILAVGGVELGGAEDVEGGLLGIGHCVSL